MDHDWLGRLVDRHAAALELYARQWCDTPEDVVQEAFLKLASQRSLPDKPAAWLFRVVRNGALNAALAVIKWKKLVGFYADFRHEHHSTYTIEVNMLLSGETNP